MSRASDTDAEPLVAELVSYAVGCVFGRWDVRFATGGKPAPTLPDPFDPLTVCSPGMLQEPDGLPATQNPHGYPLRIDWDGILVDDPDHPNDVIRRVRDVLEVIWKDRADAIEKEACEILGVARPAGLFPQAGGGRLLGRPREAVFQEPPQGSDLLAAPVVEEELRPLDLLPPVRQGHPLQSPPQLRRAQDPQRGIPPRRAAVPEDRSSAPPPRGPRSSTRTSTARRRSSPNSGISRISSAGRRTYTSTPTSTTASSSILPRSGNSSPGRRPSPTGTT